MAIKELKEHTKMSKKDKLTFKVVLAEGVLVVSDWAALD